DGYMPMIYSIAPSPNADYIPMQPRANHPATLDIHPCSSQQADRYGYMMMLPGDSPSGREQVEYDDYMDMSQLTVAEGFSQASPEGPKISYFSLPRSYKAPSREKCEKMEYIPMSPAEPLSPPSPGEYIHMNFGSRPSHVSASPSSVNSPSTPPPSQPCYRHCCSSPDHDYLGLNMDSLLKDHPPRHSLVAPWNPPNYARPLGCSYGQASTNLDREKTHDECGDGPLRTMQRLCISEHLPFGHTEPKVIRADPQGRRRHSSETFTPSPASFVGGCGIRPSANQNLPEASRWQNSSSFDSMWSHSDASPDSAALATSTASGGTPQNTSSSY
ncbi:insulin receptor substrate 2-B-like, partial [Sinocyclocheilus rhinocerous]|uniref:insulin receptor substrate 2-B-like n=1 Tax=Sinocyclocheilus rhinocerous TaxID=307959 RepID=UPI0007B9A6C3